MRVTLVIVLTLAALALVWVFGLTLNLFAGFGFIVLGICADVVRRGAARPTASPPAAAVTALRRQHGIDYERRRAA